MGENEVASATERAWAADPILHLKVESRELSRHASSIKDETSKITPRGEELSSRALRESLCSGDPENTPSHWESVSSAKQSQTWSKSQWGNARMRYIMSAYDGNNIHPIPGR